MPQSRSSSPVTWWAPRLPRLRPQAPLEPPGPLRGKLLRSRVRPPRGRSLPANPHFRLRIAMEVPLRRLLRRDPLRRPERPPSPRVGAGDRRPPLSSTTQTRKAARRSLPQSLRRLAASQNRGHPRISLRRQRTGTTPCHAVRRRTPLQAEFARTRSLRSAANARRKASHQPGRRGYPPPQGRREARPVPRFQRRPQVRSQMGADLRIRRRLDRSGCRAMGSHSSREAGESIWSTAGCSRFGIPSCQPCRSWNHGDRRIDQPNCRSCRRWRVPVRRACGRWC